jgi:hypothetical protein
MSSDLNIALLLAGTVATLAAFGGDAWTRGNEPIIRRVTRRGWVSGVLWTFPLNWNHQGVERLSRTTACRHTRSKKHKNNSPVDLWVATVDGPNRCLVKDGAFPHTLGNALLALEYRTNRVPFDGVYAVLTAMPIISKDHLAATLKYEHTDGPHAFDLNMGLFLLSLERRLPERVP